MLHRDVRDDLATNQVISEHRFAHPLIVAVKSYPMVLHVYLQLNHSSRQKSNRRADLPPARLRALPHEVAVFELPAVEIIADRIMGLICSLFCPVNDSEPKVVGLGFEYPEGEVGRLMLGYDFVEEELDPFVYVLLYFDGVAGFAETVQEGVVFHIDGHIKLLEEIVSLDVVFTGLYLRNKGGGEWLV